jgi:simple sugar transport system substrate-binding protein
MHPLSIFVAYGIAGTVLLACSKQEASASGTPDPGAAAQLVAAAVAPLKVAFVYAGPVNETGWNFAHDRARRVVEQEFGSKLSVSVVDHVAETADAARVFSYLCDQGNQLIFGASFGLMGPMLEVASQYPGVKFEHATGFKRAANLRTYNSRMYEGTYLAGMLAGAMTKSNTLGVVGALPISEVIRNIDSFTLGALSQNPNVRTKVIWINEWFNPPKEGEAAQTLIHQGADVLLQTTDSSAVLQAAESAGVLAVGAFSDRSAIVPHAHLGSAVIDWAPYYRKAVRDTLDGVWQTGDAWWGVRQDTNDLVGLSATVPARVRERVDQVKAGLKDGSFVIWKGPLLDQSGRELLAAGQIADEEFFLHINVYVKGVEGELR